MATIYVAGAWKDYKIASVEVIKETPKQYQIDDTTLKEIHGRTYYISKRLDKVSHRYRIFLTLYDAQAWCAETLRATLQDMESNVIKVRGTIAELEAEMAQAKERVIGLVVVAMMIDMKHSLKTVTGRFIQNRATMIAEPETAGYDLDKCEGTWWGPVHVPKLSDSMIPNTARVMDYGEYLEFYPEERSE